MIAGLPGTGIGGIYYVFAAIWMPFRELLARLRGKRKPARWGLIAGQILLAVSVTAVMWITGDLLGRLITITHAMGQHATAAAHAAAAEAATVDPAAVLTGKYNFIRATFVYWTTGAVALLHLIIHGARLILRIRKARHANPANS